MRKSTAAVLPGKKNESKFNTWLRSVKVNKVLLLMLIPGILYYILFKYKPMYGVLIAFKEYNLIEGVTKSPWVGMKYFNMTFQSPDFWRVFKNTLILSAYKLIFTFPAPIILALMLNEVRCMKFKKTVQTLTYLPHFLSWVVLSGIVINFLSQIGRASCRERVSPRV